MPLSPIRSVYTVAQDMDLMHAFYGEALELPLAFRDRDKWCQFKAGLVSFALSSSRKRLLERAAAWSYSTRLTLRCSCNGSSGSAEGTFPAATWALTAASPHLPTPRTICFSCRSDPAARPGPP
jgi:hypothetical protein